MIIMRYSIYHRKRKDNKVERNVTRKERSKNSNQEECVYEKTMTRKKR